jgi:preprotein translocase subunit Sss1
MPQETETLKTSHAALAGIAIIGGVALLVTDTHRTIIKFVWDILASFYDSHIAF